MPPLASPRSFLRDLFVCRRDASWAATRPDWLLAALILSRICCDERSGEERSDEQKVVSYYIAMQTTIVATLLAPPHLFLVLDKPHLACKIASSLLPFVGGYFLVGGRIPSRRTSLEKKQLVHFGLVLLGLCCEPRE